MRISILMILILIYTTGQAETGLTLVKAGKSDYHIIIPNKATPIEQKAAMVLQLYMNQIAGVKLSINDDSSPARPEEILIGNTNRQWIKKIPSLQHEGIYIATSATKLMLQGDGKGTLYAVYTFLEDYLGCRKYSSKVKYVPKNETILIPSIEVQYSPKNAFRAVYYPDPETDQEYLDWHKLHRIDESWGLWGHSFDKLVPAKKYFATHPEYFALVENKRRPAQLCMSNADVLAIASQSLAKILNENPKAQYWSVSQNDGNGYCECDKCSALNKKYGSPQGALLHFVNQIANNYPDREITTLAYGWSRKPPIGIKPAKNVTILFSTIEVNRSKPIAIDARSDSFRKDYEGWLKLTKKVIVWDYVAQFTNYISPFPNFNTLQPNLRYFMEQHPTGFFMQGSETVPSEFSELKSYILAKLLWNEKLDAQMLRSEFMAAFYGKASTHLMEYLYAIEKQVAIYNQRLDIYDNPIKPYRSYLNPKLMDEYGHFLKDALQAVKDNRELYLRTEAAVLPLNFAVLQQARFYGLEANGVFEQKGMGFKLRDGIATQVDELISGLKAAAITQLNEDGLSVSDYQQQWEQLLKKGPKIHLALNKPIRLLTPNDDELTGKGARTLVDGTEGNLDFQYNWLGWYGNDMVVVIDLENPTLIKKVSLSFLENQRHNMFLPAELEFEIAEDGENFKKVASIKPAMPDENYLASIHHYDFDFSEIKTRYLKITAKNLKFLPEWKYSKGKKPMLLCDEIVIE